MQTGMEKIKQRRHRKKGDAIFYRGIRENPNEKEAIDLKDQEHQPDDYILHFWLLHVYSDRFGPI